MLDATYIIIAVIQEIMQLYKSQNGQNSGSTVEINYDGNAKFVSTVFAGINYY